MMRSLSIVLLPIVFLCFGCSHNGTIETRLIALEQSVKDANNNRDLEIEKINLALDEIKKEQASLRAIEEENQKRISQLESPKVSGRSQEERLQGAVTFIKGSTAFISLGEHDGIKLGDVFEVYTDRESKEKIASIKITAVDLRSSSAEIEEKIQDIDIGYFVKSAQ